MHILSLFYFFSKKMYGFLGTSPPYLYLIYVSLSFYNFIANIFVIVLFYAVLPVCVSSCQLAMKIGPHPPPPRWDAPQFDNH